MPQVFGTGPRKTQVTPEEPLSFSRAAWNILFVERRSGMDFLDRVLTCSDCCQEFVFTAGEQLFFFDKQFKNDPKRCKPCKGKRQGIHLAKPGSSTVTGGGFRTETRTSCSTCGVDTTVPFRPTQGRPVLCRECFQKRQTPLVASATTMVERAQAVSQMNSATTELIAASAGAEHLAVPLELVAATAPS